MMNSVQSFIDRQYGNYFMKNYDTAIKRLRCIKEDEFQKIQLEIPQDNNDTPVFACKFAQCSGYEHILALANEEGYIAIHNTELNRSNTETSQRYAISAHYNAIFDLAWMFGQMKLVSVSGDHTARLFDISRSEIVEERIFHGHTRSIKTVAFRKDDPAVFATGSRDGSIFVWDTRAIVPTTHYITNPDSIICNSHTVPNTPGSGSKTKKKFTSTAVSPANSVTSIVFQDDNTLISCGAGDGVIKVWDLRKNYQIHKNAPIPKCVLPYAGNTTRNGFSNLLIDSSRVKLYASCLDNNIYCYNIATYDPNPIMTYTGHQNSSFYIKSSLSADGSYLISGSSDNLAYIWNTNKSTPLVYLTGHLAEVTCVAWCQKGYTTLVTCSDDMRHKIWRLHDGDVPEEWNVYGRGEAVPIENRPTTKLLSTPSSNKRTLQYTPSSQRKKSRICESCQMLTPGSFESLNCQNCKISVVRSGKRSSSQAELSPPKDTKRQNTDRTPRRLFEPSTSRQTDHILATILEENSPEKHTFSLTANLPNYVVDGEAPHLKNYSPEKKVDRDWLTKLRTEQHLRNQLVELSKPSSPKQPKLCDNTNFSPKSSKKNKKNTNNTSIHKSPLMRFFRVTNNSLRTPCENQCSPIINSSISSDYQQQFF